MDVMKESKITIMAFFIALSLMLMILSYSPLVCFYVLIIYMSIGGAMNKLQRVVFAIVGILSISLIYASRNYIYEAGNDDFSSLYLPLYYLIKNGGSVFYAPFSGGIEFLLPLYYKIISIFYTGQNGAFLILLLVATCGLFFYIWLERFGFKNLTPFQCSICLASSLMLFGGFNCSQYVRQALSTIFLLFSLSYMTEGRKSKSFVFILIASLFHLTAIPLFFIFLSFLNRKKKYSTMIIISTIIIVLTFSFFVSFVVSNSLLGDATYKIGYYSKDNLNSSLQYPSLKFFIIIVLGYFIFNKNKTESGEMKGLAFFGTIFYVLLIPIPLASERTLMLLTTYMTGYLLFKAYYKKPILLQGMIILFCIFKLYTLGPAYHSTKGEEMNTLWISYQYASADMLYYFNSLLR